jgi:uncharacterized membrane protein YgcG
MIRQEFDKTTQAHAVHSDTRVQQTAARSAQEIAEEKKLNDEKEAEAQRALAMAEALDIQLLSLNQDTLEQKKQLLNAETQAQRTKINKEISDARAKESLLAQLDKVHAARVVQLTKAESIIKRDAAFKVVEDTLETLSIINSMQSGHTKAQLARARVILALEKAIAIARLWSAEAGKGVVGIALAAAGTAVLVAQYAQQSKALGEASKMSDGTQEFKTTTDLGNGQEFSDTTTSGGSSSGSTTSGGISSLGSSGGGSSGGGGGSTIINVGGVVVNFSTDTLDLNNVDMVAQRLGEAVKRGTTEAVQMAIALYNSGEKNAGVAR